MVRQNCMADQTMHAQATGKRLSGTEEEFGVPSRKKPHVLSEKGSSLNEMAEVVKQPRQTQ